MLKVSKTALLFIAGIVWLAAGVNIARLGILSFGQMSQSMWWMLVIGAIAVFTVFHIKVFSKMVGKHANRSLATLRIKSPSGVSSMPPVTS